MKRTHLPLNGLRVLDAAARHLSFTRAADELAVTPAAVGQQIRALEDQLGTALFLRTPKGMDLTEAGQTLLAEVPNLLALAQPCGQISRRRCVGAGALCREAEAAVGVAM